MSYFLSGLWVEDEAVYICEAHNHFGKIQAQARIIVTGLGTCNKTVCLSDFDSTSVTFSLSLYL